MILLLLMHSAKLEMHQQQYTPSKKIKCDEYSCQNNKTKIKWNWFWDGNEWVCKFQVTEHFRRSVQQPKWHSGFSFFLLFLSVNFKIKQFAIMNLLLQYYCCCWYILFFFSISVVCLIFHCLYWYIFYMRHELMYTTYDIMICFIVYFNGISSYYGICVNRMKRQWYFNKLHSIFE